MVSILLYSKTKLPRNNKQAINFSQPGLHCDAFFLVLLRVLTPSLTALIP